MITLQAAITFGFYRSKKKDILVSCTTPPPLPPLFQECVLDDIYIYRDFGATISLTNKKLAERVTH